MLKSRSAAKREKSKQDEEAFEAFLVVFFVGAIFIVYFNASQPPEDFGFFGVVSIDFLYLISAFSSSAY